MLGILFFMNSLTAPNVPESAREEATEHDKLTVKQSKELVKAISHHGES